MGQQQQQQHGARGERQVVYARGFPHVQLGSGATCCLSEECSAIGRVL
jgi:hypothetical protein